MRNHKDLIVWQKSMELVKKLYQVTQCFPKEEAYGITSQMRRAAISIPSNIAEGYGRGHDRELIQFLYISLGSASELETQLIISNDIHYLPDNSYQELSCLNNEIILMLSSLINKRVQSPLST
ncbi:four helix bundle protein [Bacteroides sp.]